MFGTNSCIRLLPFEPEVRGVHRERHRQIALHRDLPVLRVADAEFRIDRKRVERGGDAERLADEEAVGKRQRVLRRVADAERRRERRLLRQQRGDRLIDVGVAIDAVARANHERRARHRTPRDTEARLETALVRAHERLRKSSPVSEPVASSPGPARVA